MYKTIRHGENSLQYTILPQNDDFRIEGKLSSAGSSCTSGRTGRKSKVKRPKRRSFFAYLGLIFVCTVIVGAVLIPFLVSAECLPSPTEWFLKTKAALTKSTGSGGSVETKEKINNVNSDGIGRNMLGNGINVGKTVKIINKDGVEKIIVRVNTTEGESVKAAAEIVNENKVYLPDEQKQPMEITSNISILNRTNQNVEKLTAGNDAMIVTDQVKQTEAETQQSASETMISENEIDYEKSDFIPSNQNNNNNEPITQPENVNVVSEIRFDTPAQNTKDNRLLSVIAPTIVVTTLRNTQNNNNNNYNSKSINEASSPKQFVATAQTAANIRPTLSFSASNVNSPRAPSNPNQNQLAFNNYSAMPTIVTRIIQVPLLKSAAKKPIIPPVLVKTNSELSATTTNNNNNNGPTNYGPTTANGYNGNGAPENSIVEQQPKNSNWIHWPYIDPSTYFQWTGYKAEDSVLLPALLGFALIGMILIITVCLVARNKRTIVSSVRKRNRNDIEETGAEDNTTLLTTNLSDED